MEKSRKDIFYLYDQSIQWIHELEFMNDEQVFLEHLLSAHFLDLSSSNLYETTRKMIKKLKEVEALGKDLMDTIMIYNRHMATLTENSQKGIEIGMAKDQLYIKKDFDNYALKFKYVKRKIFGIIKDIMRDHKQKLLLNKV